MLDTLTRAREIIDAEAAALKRIPLDKNFAAAVDAIVQCSGKVITTGIGKAGIVAHKAASTFCSNGIPAAFIHPAEAAHGDLGLLAPGDVIVVFSTSGKTREIIEMLERVPRLGVDTIIGITSTTTHPDSPIPGLCSIVIDMGAVLEPCPLALTPSASSAVMLAIGDALSLVAMERRGFTLEDYGLRHHGGYLGKKAADPNHRP
jgi:arabinose-5-phosphate isomerase